MDKRTLHAIFCDDIRHEMSGKLSLIGCYAGVMYIPLFPVTIPHLCVHFTITTPHEAPFSGPLTMTVLRDEDTLTKMELDASWTKNFPLVTEPVLDVYMFTGAAIIPPTVFKGPSTVRIVADFDDEFLYGPALRIMRPTKESEGDAG